MKKIIFAIVLMGIAGLPAVLKAQDAKEDKPGTENLDKKDKDKPERTATEEIIIRNKGDKELNLKLEINGDNITVNGKPLVEFKNDQVTINKRKMIIKNGDDFSFHMSPDVFTYNNDFKGEWKAGKTVTRPFLGVTTEKVTEGAKISEVIKESAAEKAGLKVGDIITKVGNEKVTDPDDLSETISGKKAKETITVAYIRNGKAGSVKAVLGEKKIQTPPAFAFGPRAKMKSFSSPNFHMAPDDDQLRSLDNLELLEDDGALDFHPYIHLDNRAFPRQMRLGLQIQDTEEGGNVKVIDVQEGSAAEKAGLKKDDIITEIDGHKIDNTDEAREQLMPDESKTAYTIKVKRAGAEMSFNVKFPKKLKTANL